MDQTLSPDAWAQEQAKTASITVDQLEALIKDYHEKRAKKDELSALKTEAEKVCAEAQNKVIEAMEQLGKSKAFVEGIGTVYFSDKFVVPTPKTVADKTKLFNWMKEKYGGTFLMDKTSINHQTLQTFYSSAFQDYLNECAEKGIEPDATFIIPGLEAPTNLRTLNFRKERTK